MKIVLFDTETSGLPKNYNGKIKDLDNWPRVIQLAWSVLEFGTEFKDFTKIKECEFIIKPNGFEIPEAVSKIHGITTQIAFTEGVDLEEVLMKFNADCGESEFLIAHNIDFDFPILGAEFLRIGLEDAAMFNLHQRCTMKSTTSLVGARNSRGGIKWPKLMELHEFLFNIGFDNAHNALADVQALEKCFIELVKRDIKLVKGKYNGTK